MKSYCVFFAFLITIIACQNKASTTAFVPLDLLQYGIPITIMAPDSVAIKKSTLSFSQDITIKGEAAGYDLQIFAYNATTTDLVAVKAEHVAEAKSNPYFSKMIEEDPNGFIYEMAYDSTNMSYGFKYLRIQGDKEYIFQNAMVGSFNLEDTKQMYKAVKNEL